MSQSQSIDTILESSTPQEGLSDLEKFFEHENDIFSDLEELPEGVEGGEESIPKVEEPKKEEPSTSTSTTTSTETAQETELYKQETLAARQLFNALKDPELGPVILEYLNKKQTGNNKEVFNPLIELKKAFPEGYENIAEQLAPALAKVVDKAVELKVAPVLKANEANTYEKNAQLVQETYDDFAKTQLGVDKVPENYDSHIAKLVKQFPWNGEGEISTYTKSLLFMTKGELGVPVAKTTPTETTSKKTSSPLGKLATAPKPSGDGSVKPSSQQKQTLTQAFDAALRGLR